MAEPKNRGKKKDRKRAEMGALTLEGDCSMYYKVLSPYSTEGTRSLVSLGHILYPHEDTRGEAKEGGRGSRKLPCASCEGHSLHVPSLSVLIAVTRETCPSPAVRV